MSMQAHVAELERRHEALDKELKAEMSRPLSDGPKIAELKRRKLHLKDEITRLRVTRGITLH